MFIYLENTNKTFISLAFFLPWLSLPGWEAFALLLAEGGRQGQRKGEKSPPCTHQLSPSPFRDQAPFTCSIYCAPEQSESCQAPVVIDLDRILLLLTSVAQLVLLPAGVGRAHGAWVVQPLVPELKAAPDGSDDSRV